MQNSRVTVVENSPAPVRRRGRPPAFERNQVLTRAAETFWRLGYEGASIADLTEAMGITAQSLYAAFGSKADLYKEALAHYRHTIGAFTAHALTQERNAADAFVRLLKEAASEFCKAGRPQGCMISTATLACASENQPVADHVAGLRAGALAAFQDRIERGVAEGHFRPDTDAAALARYLGAIIQGMSVQARDGASEEELASLAAIASAEVNRHRT
ncbi:TetR/AcrR family transcriptional regulator [Microvirga sp. GCM10011540]|uniref:TetR/AcrR family transcriptional regulator n=1 Tax=Microvirga sp. GCM10011540 TaxID=3317338 RepID=UPI0036077614